MARPLESVNVRIISAGSDMHQNFEEKKSQNSGTDEKSKQIRNNMLHVEGPSGTIHKDTDDG